MAKTVPDHDTRDLNPEARPSQSGGQNLSLVLAVFLIAFYLITSLFIASHRLFWYDEISTVLIARMPNFSTIWKVVSSPCDAMPPGYFMFVSLFDRAFGPGEIAARLPSALALAVGLIITFDCARRLCDNLHALAGLALLTCSFLPYYGYEARPYTLYFMFAAMGLWLWLHASRWSAPLFGITVFLAFNIHYYSALCLIPYFALEAWQWKPWRAPSAKLIAGCLAVLCGLVLLSHPILAARQIAPDFWAPPSLDALLKVFGEFFPVGVFLFASILIWIALTGERGKLLLDAMPLSERLGWFFLLIPMVGYLGALVTNAFYHRYFIGLLPGVAIAFASLLWRHFRHTPRVSAGIVGILLLVGVGNQIKVAAHPSTIVPSSVPNSPGDIRAVLSMEAVFAKDGKTNIVVPADNLLALEGRYYSKYPGAYALLLHPNMGPPGKMHLNLSRYMPMRFWTLDDLRAHARESALINPSRETLKAMTDSGFQIQPILSKRVTIVYLK